MASTPIFEGSWDPRPGAFPVVPSAITSAYYLVTHPGKVGNFNFGEGDWLLYLEEAGTPPGTGSWYRTSGGIIQLATVTQQASFDSSDITDFSAAANAAILVDNTTIVKDPTTGALHVIVPSGPSVTNIIEEEDTTYVPPHGHVSKDTSDFIQAVRESLGPTSANTPFFSNTALTNAVVFSYNNTLNTVSADVKIDNSTIVKNKYGQLVAGKPQPLSITDILGLSAYLDNYASQFADPTLAPLHAAPPAGGAWSPPGTHNFANIKIGDAIQTLNIDVSDIVTSIAHLTASFQGVIPVPPPALSSKIVPVLDPQVAFYEAYKAGASAPTIIGVTARRNPATLPTALFYKGIWNGPAGGGLTALIDGQSVGNISPLNPSQDQSGSSHSNGALFIAEDQDSYLLEPAFHNLFKSISARIAPTIPLSAGEHHYQFQETLPGTGAVLSSGVLTVNIDVPSTTMSIDTGAVTYFLPPAARFVSGVLALDPSTPYTLSPITAENVVGYAYGQYIVHVTAGPDTHLSLPTTDLPAAEVPTAPAYKEGKYNSAITAPFTFSIRDQYNENPTINLAPYNSHGDLGPAALLSLGRVDATVENNRVFSGDPTLTYPTISSPNGCGSLWNSTKSLVEADYRGELQKINQNYQWPTGNYPTGPNYSMASGVQIAGQSGTWRWVTLKLAASIIGKVAFTLSFTGGNVETWISNPYTCHTEGILIYAKLANSGWVDCNTPYRGIGVSDTDGAFAMDTRGHNGYETTALVKRVTLGPSSANSSLGDLYVRVAIPSGSTKQFSDIAVSDWA